MFQQITEIGTVHKPSFLKERNGDWALHIPKNGKHHLSRGSLSLELLNWRAYVLPLHRLSFGLGLIVPNPCLVTCDHLLQKLITILFIKEEALLGQLDPPLLVLCSKHLWHPLPADFRVTKVIMYNLCGVPTDKLKVLAISSTVTLLSD